MVARASLVATLLLLLGACAPPPAPAPPPPPKPLHPPTAKHPVTDAYHGVKVTEDYRWLESWDDPAVKEWSGAQHAHARAYLDALPAMAAVKGRLSRILRAEVVEHGACSFRGGKLFALRHQPPKQQPFLVVMDSPDAPDSARVVVDPNAIDQKGTTHVDWYFPSHDGSLVAVSLSRRGTESGDVHVYDVATGKQVHEVVQRVNGGTAGGSLAWLADGSGFFYTRYPRQGERPKEDMDFYVQIYLHKLGTPPADDRYELGKDFPRIAEIELVVEPKSGRLLATVQKGDGGEFAHYLRTPSESGAGTWQELSVFGDRTIQMAFGANDDLYVLSRKDAPRGKILRLPLADPKPESATEVVAEGQDTLVDSFWGAPSIVATASRLYLLYQLGGPSEIRVFDLEGKRLAAPKQLPVAAAGDMTRLDGEQILFSNASFVEPPAYYRFDAATGETHKTALAVRSPVDMSAVKVVREMAASKDGTKVPVNILLPPGAKLDGTGACVVTGYGGYGVNIVPRFRAFYATLLEQGVCYAVANLRGGGEYGEAWHRAGNLTNKQNVFDDFAAVLQHMVQRKYTAPDRLAILGGSNGGLLMGATMVQHPKLVKAVVSFVGIYDMLRVELSPNGAFNVTEFGTVKDPALFRALHAYSPYHNVKDGTAYPAVLMLTGENDPRVDPMQSRKMVARLQAASSSRAPVLLRTSSDSGHGGGTGLEEHIAELADAYTFLLHQLGMSYQAK